MQFKTTHDGVVHYLKMVWNKGVSTLNTAGGGGGGWAAEGYFYPTFFTSLPPPPVPTPMEPGASCIKVRGLIHSLLKTEVDNSQLRARRELSLIQRRSIENQKGAIVIDIVYSDSVLLVLNGTSFEYW